MLNLQDLCKNVILKHVTIRRLAISESRLPIPKRLWQYIAELSIADFEIIESAPLTDVFGFNYFYRALTYKVVCLLDEQEYMIAFGYNPFGDVQRKDDHEQWVKVQHKNIMSVCATVQDYDTKNIFYVYDQPLVTLEKVWKMFFVKNLPMSKSFLDHLMTDLCEALRFMRSNGLQYSHFGMANIFVMNNRLVFENGLMLKSLEFITDRRNGYRPDEQSTVRDTTKMLKLLLKDQGNQQPLLKLIDEIESRKCLDNLLQKLNRSQESNDSFSFGELIQKLKFE